MTLIIPKNVTSGKELVIIPKEEYEALMIFKTIYEFQPTSSQKKTLEKARKNRKKGDYISIGELKTQLGLTN